MRYPVAATAYYSGNKKVLAEQIDKLFEDVKEETETNRIKRVSGLIVPHGSYKNTGEILAAAYATIKDVKPWTTFVIIGTDHFERGKPIAISREDWITPLGIVKNDREFGGALKKNSELADFDERAHAYERAVETQLPFIQKLVKEPKAVEISVAVHSYDVALDLANAIIEAKKETGREIMIIASSDFDFEKIDKEKNETEEAVEERVNKDNKRAIKSIESLEAEEFTDMVDFNQLTICGPGPIATLMILSKKDGASIDLLKEKTVKTKTEVSSYASFAAHK